MKKLFTLLFVCILIISSKAQDFVTSTSNDSYNGEMHSAGDFDGDGFVDVVTGFWDFTSKGDLFFYKNGKTTPVSFVKSALDKQLGIWSISKPIDFDQDGDLDIIYAQRSDNALFAYENDGKGKFTSKSLDVKGTTIHSAADMNGDKILDIVGHNITDKTVMVYTRGINGTYTTKTLSLNGFKVSQHRLADTDKDGDIDIILSATGYSDQIIIMVNDGKNEYTLTKILKEGFNSYEKISFGDVNNDGLVDILGVSQYSVLLLTNKGGNKFDKEIMIDSDVNVQYNGIEIGDLNGDGKQDIIAGGARENLFWFKNVSTPQELKFEKILITDVSGHFRLSILDIDNDKDLDIITNNNYLRWVTNNVKQETSSAGDEGQVSIKIYPNPVSQEVTIEGLNSDAFSAIIYNTVGIQVLNADIIKNTVDVRTLGSGVYIMQVRDQRGNIVVSKRIVKQ